MRVVVKVGTSTLAHATGRLNIKRTNELCAVLSDLKNAGHEVILDPRAHRDRERKPREHEDQPRYLSIRGYI